MKGVGVTILQLLCGTVVQRRLAAVGLALTLAGIAGLRNGWNPNAEPLFAAAATSGMVATVAYPILLDALLFRWLSAPRAVQLIPGGKVKLLLGAFGSQLLLALFIDVTVAALRPGGPKTTPFVVAFSGVSAVFLSSFWGCKRPQRAGLWALYIVIPILVGVALSNAYLRALIVSPMGLASLLIITLLAWLLFAVTYLRARHILAPQWKENSCELTAGRSSAASSFTRPQAIRILLSGYRSRRAVKIWTGVILGAAYIFILIVTVHAKDAGRFALMWAFLICFYGSLIPGIVVGSLGRRARFLWLTAGLGRGELFEMLETLGWRTVFWVLGIGVVLAVPLFAHGVHSDHAHLRDLGVLAMPLATGAVFVYASLMMVRGERLADSVIWLGLIALLSVDFLSVPIESLRANLPVLLAAQIVAVPLLRAIAKRRWQSIDWLLHKPLERGLAARIGG